MKPITIHTPKGTNLYCAPNDCYMTRNGCLRRQKAVADGLHMVNGEACIGCPIGESVKQQMETDRDAPATGTGNPEKPQCIWPGCTKKPVGLGLCAAHHRRCRRNLLIRCNTATGKPETIKPLLKRLIRIAESRQIPVEDVALVCLDKGIQALEAIKY